MRTLLLAASSSAALLALACSKSKQPSQVAHNPPPTAADSSSAAVTSQKQLAADIRKQGVTPERAKQLFSMVVGPLPGMAAPVSDRDQSDFDGTLAVGYIYQVWSSLTLEQRRAAAHLIDGGSGPAGGGASHASARRDHAPVFRFASFGATASDTPAFNYPTLVQNANGNLAAFLNVPAVGVVANVEYGTPLGTEFAHTISWWKPIDSPLFDWKAYPGGKCHITIWNQKFQSLDETGAEAIITHEMFHCYEQRVAQTMDVMLGIHAWIVEGEATWVMAAVVPAVGGTIMDTKWSPYVFGPKTVYSDRSYDAIGVFGHESDLAGDADVWPKLLPMVAAGENGDDATPFSMLIKGRESTYYTSWGSSYFESKGNLPWSMNGPADPPTSGPAPDVVTVNAGTNDMLTPTPSDEAQLWQLEGDADIVVVTLYVGYGRLHDSGFGLDTELGNGAGLALCLKKGGCTCPDGTPGASLITKPATAPISVGVDGGDVTVQIGVVGKSLDEFCKKPDPKPPAPQPGGGGGGGGGGGAGADSNQKQPPDLPPEGATYGDTHLTTFDGLHYDLQAVGEFTLVRSTKDDFTVQVRQVAAIGSRAVALNRAMATKLGRDTVSVSLENRVAILRIDGKVITGALPILKGGVISRSTNMGGDAYELTWPDGTVLYAEQSGWTAMKVRVRPAASRRGTLVGLLGNDDGSPVNDLIGLREARLGTHPSDSVVTHSLADAWRITQAQSLFTYQPGQSTATFTNHNFPDKAFDPSKVATRAAAEKYCRELEITDQHLLDDCILDLAVTNDFVFGSEYAHAQQVLALRAALAGPPKAPSGTPVTVIMTGEILDSKSQPQFQFNGKKDDVIWVHDSNPSLLVPSPYCVDKLPQFHPVYIALYDPDGKPVGGFGQGCDFGRRELPVTGTYTFKANFQYPNEIVRWRIPIRFVRPNRHLSLAYGQMVSGNIEQRAARDIYTFTGNAGDVIKIAGAGCDLGSMFLSVFDPDGHDIGGIDCRNGSDVKLREVGTYQLIMNVLDWGPAPYHFVFQGGAFK